MRIRIFTLAVLLLAFEVSEELARADPDLGRSVRWLIEGGLEGNHRVLEHDPGKKTRGTADAARVAVSLG